MAFGFRPVAAGITAIAMLSMTHVGLVSSAFAQSSAAPLPASIAVAALPSSASPSRIELAPEIQSTVRAAVPASSGQTHAQPSAKDSWTIVLVQTALAEKGCRDVAINGAWDQPTEVATLMALALPQRQEPLVLDDNLVRLVRSAPSTICPPWAWGTDLGPQPQGRRQPRAPQADPRAVTAQGRKSATAKSSQPSARQAGTASTPRRVATTVKVARSSVSVARMTVNVPVF